MPELKIIPGEEFNLILGIFACPTNGFPKHWIVELSSLQQYMDKLISFSLGINKKIMRNIPNKLFEN